MCSLLKGWVAWLGSLGAVETVGALPTLMLPRLLAFFVRLRRLRDGADRLLKLVVEVELKPIAFHSLV